MQNYEYYLLLSDKEKDSLVDAFNFILSNNTNPTVCKQIDNLKCKIKRKKQST